uniref:Phorbol-ester/DAG-type domain-containing protein n=1 Tax=Acrobeloides nanus TaxID=290746 RepID=A0A914CNJ5_9BILA
MESNSRWYTATRFQWTIENPANGISFDFVFPRKEESQRVYKDFENALKSINLSESDINDHKHELRTKVYSTPTMCEACNKLFDVLGYNCERCHKIFDLECLKTAPCSRMSFDLNIRKLTSQLFI